MKTIRILLVFLIACITFTGCSEKVARKPEDVQRLLMKLRSYQCDVILAVTNNKSTNVYKARHMYKYPDKYRLELLEPMELKGQTTIYNGEQAYIYHPQINTYLLTQNFKDTADGYGAFIGAFIDDYKNNGGVRYSLEDLQDKQCYVLERPINKGSKYRVLEKIWIDAEQILPVKAEILDKDNKLSVQVLYENFVVNPTLGDELFEIKK